MTFFRGEKFNETLSESFNNNFKSLNITYVEFSQAVKIFTYPLYF